MKLTQAEKQVVLKMREEDKDNKPKKTGITKHDIWWRSDSKWRGSNTRYLSLEQVKSEIESFSSIFEMGVKAGSEFVCYINKDTGYHEQWYDDVGFGIEGMDSKWAKENLQDIRSIK